MKKTIAIAFIIVVLAYFYEKYIGGKTVVMEFEDQAEKLHRQKLARGDFGGIFIEGTPSRMEKGGI